MRVGSEWLCDTRAEPGCQRNAALTFICPVEGREVSLCLNCDRVWKAFARRSPELGRRCPGCAPIYIEQHRIEIEVHQVRISGADDEVLTGPLADALSAAMRSEGILIDVRRRVLVRLARQASEDSHGYVGALLRTTSAAAPKSEQVPA